MSLLGEAVGAAIVYVILLLAAFVVGVVSAQAGAWLTIILILGNVAYLVKISEASWSFIRKQFLPVVVTGGMANLLQQPLDYAFAITFFVVLLARWVELYEKQ